MPLNWPLLSLTEPPTDGINEVQTLTVTGSPSSGSLTLNFDGQTTAAIPYNATAAQVDSALQALSNIEAGDVACAGGPLPNTAVTITFRRKLGGKDVSEMTADASLLVGAGAVTAAVTTTTAGVQGTHRGAQYGCLLQDICNGVLYKNTGDVYTPVWTEYEP